ncbi:hypothetical protein MACJ_003652 [Theileria orientalis]|uniref:Uncharacterized protein n=1 Tax=Theileria orientalis TaxID=68886 RepID=A0A976XK52_THEOR|nr:hypothetical protein MACJ_003652 [Theileria orientalis]
MLSKFSLPHIRH